MLDLATPSISDGGSQQSLNEICVACNFLLLSLMIFINFSNSPLPKSATLNVTLGGKICDSCWNDTWINIYYFSIFKKR